MQIAVGAILSSTVTIEVQVDTLPWTSVTFSLTVFGPRFAQLNAVGALPVAGVEGDQGYSQGVDAEVPHIVR